MARYLLDTHTFLWAVNGDPRLSQSVAALIRHPDNRSYVSVASIWEIVIKVGVGKMPALSRDPDVLLDEAGLLLLDIGLAHARQVASLPSHHRDPFDRMLIAQAQVEGLILITDDWKIERYGTPTLRP